jgi:hypothetical protein
LPKIRHATASNARLSRADGPEDGLQDRCLRGGLPEFGSLLGGSFAVWRRRVAFHSSMDVNQGEGWQRNVVMKGSPHLPANIRQ